MVVVVTTPAPWQRVEVAGVKEEMLTVGVIVTTLLALVVPQSPVEVAVIVAEPLKATSQFITPLAAPITPAATGDTL